MQTTEQLELVRRISALEKEVKELHAVEGPLPRDGFSVSLSANQSAIVVGAAATAEFDTEAYDYLGGFNTATHTFTSQVNGVYLMMPQIRLQDIDTAATRIQFKLITTPRTYTAELTPNALAVDADYWTMQLAHACRLAATETAYCTIEITGGANQTDIVSGGGTRWTCWLIG